MQITDEGNLRLHMIDLWPEANGLIVPQMEWINLDWFTHEAQIAVWYARQVKAKVMFLSQYDDFSVKAHCPVAGMGHYGYPRSYRKNKWDKALHAKVCAPGTMHAQIAEATAGRKS